MADKTVTLRHRRRFWRAPLAILSVLATATVPAVALAQCPQGAHTYINPRLAPQRPQVSRQQLEAAFANPAVPAELKRQILDLFLNQNEPIQVPYRNGTVLISPKDPCIQQYLGN